MGLEVKGQTKARAVLQLKVVVHCVKLTCIAPAESFNFLYFFPLKLAVSVIGLWLISHHNP